MKKQKVMNICFVTDESYAAYAGVVIASILANAEKDTNFAFYLFDNGITDTTKSKLKTVENDHVKIIFVDVSGITNEMSKLKQCVKHISKASYLKFFMADLLPDIDKLLYLDCDLIVKTSLNELYDTDLKSNLIAAVEDVGYTYWCKHNEELKLKFLCMNSGVMLVNCDLWRKEKLSDKLVACAQDHDKVGFGQDQPVLNFVLRDRVLFLPFKWNVQDTFFRDEIELQNRPERTEIDAIKENPGIIHYTFVRKPWNDFAVVRARDFWEFYLKTPFCDNHDKQIYFSYIHLSDKIDQIIIKNNKRRLKYRIVRSLSHITFGKLRKYLRAKKEKMEKGF